MQPFMVYALTRFEAHERNRIMNHIFTVEGMTCAHCEKAITRALLSLDALANVVIDRQQNIVQIDSVKSREALAQAMREEGYLVLV